MLFRSIKGFVYHAIDISSAQKKINWEIVRKDGNINIVYILATHGNRDKDSFYKENMVGAREAGLSVGSTHRFTNAPVAEQLSNFAQTVAVHTQDLIPMVEIRKSDIQGETWMDSLVCFVKKIEETYGCKPLVSVENGHYNACLSHRLPGYPLMISCYSGQKPSLDDQNRYVLWRFTEKGIINGVGRSVPLSRFHTDM